VTRDPPASRAARLTKPLEDAVRGGHPWIFADAVALPAGAKDGDVAELVDRRGEFLARGTVEPSSPLAFRVWTLEREEKVDGELVRSRLASALAMRRELLRADVTAFRVCHGESDFVPGLQCDLYGDVASLRTDGELGVAWERLFVDAVRDVVKPRAIVVRNPRTGEGEARLVHGALDAKSGGAGPRDGEVVVVEHGRRFVVDVLRGQKTGFFVDQRDNRDRVGAIARGRRVLNLFAYTGGFSVAAALGGATSVTTVDVAAPAIETARRNFLLNGLDPALHEFQVSDAFDVLADLSARAHHVRTNAKTVGDERGDVATSTALGTAPFDLIVLDPPSFAPSRKTVDRGTKAYEKLNELALRSLPRGGWLATASCSSHVSERDFLAIVAEAARRARRDVTIASVSGAGPDHPVRLGFPEGRYLKFVLLRVR
jgi:23S rRNA (cytosine1962-C5)-methyltransferase